MQKPNTQGSRSGAIQRAQGAFGAGAVSGAVSGGRYLVQCFAMRDVIADLDRNFGNVRQRLFRRDWRTRFGGSPIRAALALGRINRQELFSLLNWEAVVRSNLVVNAGLDAYLQQLWLSSAFTSQHYLGLIEGPSPTIAAGDTMASHAGWTEFLAYDEPVSGERPDLTAALGAVSGQALSTSTALEYTVNDDAVDINGAFTTTGAAKGGTTGTLVTAGTFEEGNRPANTDDVLSVSITLTQAAAA